MNLPMRKPNRLKNYDYSQNGAYFITVCTKERREILWTVGPASGRPHEPPNVGSTFGRPHDPPQLSEYGKIIRNEIERIGEIYDHIAAIDKYVIMPNHIHMIILLQGDGGRPEVAPTVSRILQQLKGSATKQIGFPLWQKSFHDHIIRSEQEYQKIWEYIDTNPMKWEEDCFYPHGNEITPSEPAAPVSPAK